MFWQISYLEFSFLVLHFFFQALLYEFFFFFFFFFKKKYYKEIFLSLNF